LNNEATKKPRSQEEIGRKKAHKAQREPLAEGVIQVGSLGALCASTLRLI
jgi:hypothetical protein